MKAVIETVLDTDKEYEIVNGQPEEKLMGGARHGGIGLRLGAKLWGHVETCRLGGVYGPDTSFQIGENERLPDLAYVAASRFPEEGEPEGAWPIAPDLAVEVVSPSDLYSKVMTRVADYLTADVRQVWVIYPQQRTVTIYSSLTDLKVLQETDHLDGGDLIPGFRCPVADLFRSPGRGGNASS
jgi:Uma2 family endonuclease